MIRLGATGSPAHLDLCRALETVFRRNGVEFDWVLYSGYDEMVDAFHARGDQPGVERPTLPRQDAPRPCPTARRYWPCATLTSALPLASSPRADSAIDTVEDLPGARFAFAARDSVEAGLLPVYFLKEMGINPTRSLAAADFFDQREPQHSSDQVDVALQVLNRALRCGSHQRPVVLKP